MKFFTSLTLLFLLTCLNSANISSNWVDKQNILTLKEKKSITDPDLRSYCYSTYNDTIDDYISNVFLSGINNSTGPEPVNCYGDYTFYTADIAIGTTYYLYVTFVSNGYTQQVKAWIDWNQNEDFTDPGEEYDLGDGIDEILHTSITIPEGAHSGATRLRITEQYNSDPGPCDPHENDYGETEDYTVNVYSNYNVWTGAVDNNWHNPENWYYYFVPDTSTSVVIPDVTNKCWVVDQGGDIAECKYLTVENGIGYNLRINDGQLLVARNMNILGELLMDHDDGVIYVEGNVTWQSGSSASILEYTEFAVWGYWMFQSGANVELNNGIVNFVGNQTSYIISHDNSCYFNDLVSNKGGSSNWTEISNACTENINIHGSLSIQYTGELKINTSQSVILFGNLYNQGVFDALSGTFIFDGIEQLIQWDYSIPYNFSFADLIISSSTSTYITNNALETISVNGDLTIEEGQFITNNSTVSVSGNWDNQVGPGGFDPGTGRVIFDGGNYHQYCSDETFNVLEIDKPLGGAFRMEGTHVVCDQYDWTAGTIDVIPGGGSFTAFDLVDDGIYGAYYLNLGGTINIHQDINSGSYVDLNGELHIFGGVMNIYGGDGYSYWPFNGDALISMYDGILDFHDQGINISDSPTYTLTESISGGTIRTAGGFWGGSSDFTPGGGTMEFYSTNDADIYTDYGCYLNDVLITKGTKDNSYAKSVDDVKSVPIIDERSGKMVSDGSKSNELTLSSFLDINGSLVIESGVLNTDGYNIQIESDWTNFVGDAGFGESTGWVVFDGDGKVANIHTNETFNNLMLSNATSGVFGLTLMDGIIVNVNNELNLQWSTLEMNPNSELHVGENIFIAFGAGLNADDGNNQISIGGHWTDENDPNTNYLGFWPGGEVVTFNGATDQILNTNGSQEDFTNVVINKPSGSFHPGTSIQIGGVLVLFNGDWQDQIPGLHHKFGGDIFIEPNGGFYPQELVTMNGGDQTYQNYGGIAMFNDLIIESNGIFTLNTDLILPDNKILILEEGVLDLNGNSFKALDVCINDGGEVRVDAGASLLYVDGIAVNNGATLTASGISGNNATIRNESSGYSFIGVYNGGTISANYTDFYDTDIEGVWVHVGAVVDTTNSFNNCNFIDGINTSPSARLIVDNDQILNINNINFFNNPYLAGASNISKATDQGEINITTTSGDFTGSLYENDPYNRIHWSMGLPEIDDLTIQYNESANEIELSWTYPAPVDQFKIYRSTDPHDFSGADVFTTTTVGFSEPASGIKYFYRVTAENISDEILRKP